MNLQNITSKNKPVRYFSFIPIKIFTTSSLRNYPLHFDHNSVVLPMNKSPYLSLLIFCICSVHFLHAQTATTGWLASFNTISTGKNTSIHNDIQLRGTDEFKQVQSFLFRIGLNVKVARTLTLTGGYAYISNKRVLGGVAGFAPEHRLWEQLIIAHKIKKLSISHRLRVEQRFISKSRVAGDELETSGNFFANRIRYFARGVLPLVSRASFSKGPFAALQNEVFVNIGDNSALNDEIFDQNRLYLAIGYRLGPSFDIEGGYLNQYINGRKRNSANNHVIQLAGYLRL